MRGKLGFSILFAGVLVSGIAWGTAFYNLGSSWKQSSSGSGGKNIQFAIEFLGRPASSNTVTYEFEVAYKNSDTSARQIYSCRNKTNMKGRKI